ncbi:GNAT family N-acetyltransferase [Parerythrobacter aurantius]|uniref:GNAT family N-acetyltransferase n=1 Tax=Parerythrobacter aurantius TaxID=3127706 RepID=UPI00324A6852
MSSSISIACSRRTTDPAMTYVLRPYRHADAHALAAVTLAAIRQVGAVAYTPEQVAAWAARHPGPGRFVERVERGATILVAAGKNDIPVAYALLEVVDGRSGHLDMLYCDPGHTRQGLADRLLAASEEEARSRELVRLFTEASELARPAFARAGYAVTHRRDFEIDGVPIHNYAMEKMLD